MAEFETIRLPAIVGPTASGKTALAVALCERFGGEVVSADSMQVYRGLEIASAKPTKEEMRGIPHHMIGCIDRTAAFSVADYCRMAAQVIGEIHRRGETPVLVGGTGLYVSALLENTAFGGEGAHPDFRQMMRERAEREGAQALWDELAAVDPAAAQTLHPNNLGRVIRALELYRFTGKTATEWNLASKQAPSPYDARVLYLTVRDRRVLYDRIDRRVEEMLRRGLLEEARALDDPPDSTAAKAIGPKELRPYFEGRITLQEAVEAVKRETRRYAKRQMTWFKRYDRYTPLYLDDYPSAAALSEAAFKWAQTAWEK